MFILNKTQRKNKRKRRVAAILTSVCLLLGILPVTALADNGADEEEIIVDKWVETNGDNFKLKLESYATGENGNVEQRQTPVDIVLVLDESGSMANLLVQGCNSEKGEDVKVKPEGHLADGVNVSDLDKELFVGHKVMADDVDEEATYTIVYPADGSTRDIHYCKTCEGWYSNPVHTDHESGKLAQWIPFEDENGKPTNEKYTDPNRTVWKCNVQFYERCGRTGKEMLQEAVTEFLHSLYESSNPEIGEEVHNRVAIVGYGQGASYISPSGNRQQVFENWTQTQAEYAFTDNAAEFAENAFCDVAAVGSEQGFTKWINGIHDTGSTPTQLGIQAAELAFGNAPDDGIKRDKVMILFTDGAPGSGYINFGPGSPTKQPDWVTKGINTAKSMKESGVTIYSVGLFPAAYGYGAGNIDYDVKRDGEGTPGFFKNANCFLHLVSSNYPSATGVEQAQWGNLSDKYIEPGSETGKDGHSYYLGTSDGDDLSEIFTHLSSILTPGATVVSLNEDTVTRDTVTDDFDIMYENEKAKVTAYTMSYTRDEDGKKQWEKDEGSDSTVGDIDDPDKLHIKVNGRNVSVTNFDFAENYVHKEGEDCKGKKLVIEIEIKAAEDSQGGDRLATNTGKPGIYPPDSSTPVAEFPLPHVDLPTTVTVKKEVKGSDSKEAFDFNAEFLEKGSYKSLSDDEDQQHTASDSNYLHIEKDIPAKKSFSLSNKGEYKLTNVAVGSELTISEETVGWHTTVTAETKDGKSETLTPDSSGSYKLNVTPGMVITFTNSAYEIKVVKVNKEGERLSGAEFLLKKQNVNGLLDTWPNVEDGVKTTDKNGEASWTGLTAGVYAVVETDAPEGYVQLAKPCMVNIPEDVNTSDGTTVTVTITNAKAPQTGGNGVMRFIVAGLIIIVGASAALVISRRKNLRG